jgi:hypothetical protein
MSRSYKANRTTSHIKTTKVYKRFHQVSFKIRGSEFNELSGAF